MMEGFISIIVPVYNVEKYLRRCVDSLLKQTYSNIEIILIDDGSRDNSGKICAEYSEQDERIRVIHKVNGGLSDARNTGIKAARGEYIGFVDSDDWISPDMYRLLYEACKKNNSEIGVCGYHRVYRDKDIVCCGVTGVYNSDIALYKLIEGVEIQDHACTKLYKASLWENIEYPVGEIYEDIRTTYKLFLKASKIAVIGQALYYYRQREGSIVREKFGEKKLEQLNAVEEMHKEVQKYTREYEEVFSARLLRVKGTLLRELLLYSDGEAFTLNTSIACEFYKQIRKNRMFLLKTSSYSKVFKLMAVLSFFNLNTTRKIFQSRLMKKYICQKYVWNE